MGGCISSQKMEQMLKKGIVERPCDVCYPAIKRKCLPPIIAAASQGHHRCVDLLIQAGADVNARDLKSNTVVMYATDKGRVKCLEMLIRAGADIKARRKDGLTAFHVACLMGHNQCLNLLIKGGVNVNTADENGNKAWIDVAMKGRAKCLQTLIKAGADVNCRRKISGETALIMACRWGHDKCVDILLKAGADMEITSFYRNTALSDAAWGGYEKCVQLLIKAGADVNNSTALSRAATVGRVKCARMLIEAGADVNRSGYKEYNNLIAAATSASIECVKLFLKSGAHVNQSYLPSRDPFYCLSHDEDRRKCAVLLYVAGEQFDDTTTEKNELFGENTPTDLEESLEITDLKLSLQHMCRETIRKHLIQLNPHSHLFGRIPKLGLPPSLSHYLLYHMSLDDVCKEEPTDEDGRNRAWSLGLWRIALW